MNRNVAPAVIDPVDVDSENVDGLPQTSISMVKLRVTSTALPFNSTLAVTARALIRDPTFTGFTKRTRLKP